jgi:hypothetical protein
MKIWHRLSAFCAERDFSLGLHRAPSSTVQYHRINGGGGAPRTTPNDIKAINARGQKARMIISTMMHKYLCVRAREDSYLGNSIRVVLVADLSGILQHGRANQN